MTPRELANRLRSLSADDLRTWFLAITEPDFLADSFPLRLQFADWLTDQGLEPWAEYIRAAVSLAIDPYWETLSPDESAAALLTVQRFTESTITGAASDLLHNPGLSDEQQLDNRWPGQRLDLHIGLPLHIRLDQKAVDRGLAERLREWPWLRSADLSMHRGFDRVPEPWRRRLWSLDWQWRRPLAVFAHDGAEPLWPTLDVLRRWNQVPDPAAFPVLRSTELSNTLLLEDHPLPPSVEELSCYAVVGTAAIAGVEGWLPQLKAFVANGSGETVDNAVLQAVDRAGVVDNLRSATVNIRSDRQTGEFADGNPIRELLNLSAERTGLPNLRSLSVHTIGSFASVWSPMLDAEHLRLRRLDLSCAVGDAPAVIARLESAFAGAFRAVPE